MLPFAGGNCYSYRFLDEFLTQFEVHSLELPGRGKRVSEPLFLNSNEAIHDYLIQIREHRKSGLPFIVYGHSMGALLGLAITAQLEKDGDAPEVFIATGSPGPGVSKSIDQNRCRMSNEELKDELRLLGGVPEEVLGNDMIFDFFSPIIRADFSIVSDGIPSSLKEINTTTFVVMGSEEEYIEYQQNWNNYVRAEVKYHTLPGDHFFIFRHPKRIGKFLQGILLTT